MLNDIQRQKIQYFNSIVNNRNENLAISYLNQANWNEAKAVELYYESASLSNSVSQNLSQPPNPPNHYRYAKAMKECHFDNDNNQGLFSQAFSYIKTTLGIKNNNSELCDNLNGIVNGLVKGSNEFILKLKDKKGVIILYSQETYQKLIDNILLINQEYMFDTIIYPIINNSDEGENLIQQLKIYNFPCYLFCKYKNERIFYVTDIIQQKLNINQFKNCLSQLDQIGINNNNNNNYINNINQPRYNADNNWQYYNQFNENRININNSNNYGYLYNSGIQPNSQNYPYNININNNNLQNYPKSEIKLNPSQNDINSNNINKKKEYIPDYRDYDLDGSLSFSYLNQSNNINNNYNYGLDNSNNNNNNSFNINNSNNNFNNNYNINNSNNSFNNNLNNSNSNLNNNSNNINISDSLQNIPVTDSFIRRKQDDEMKRLEEMEEEKERKEKEEQEQKRIEEEKEKEKLKIEKEEKELFSQIIPPEPDDSNPDKCVIIFRLPDGQKNIQRKFLKTNKISLLYDYIKSLGREIYTEDQYNNFSIIQTFPFKNFEDKLNNTLEEEGLYPNSVLQIKENN